MRILGIMFHFTLLSLLEPQASVAEQFRAPAIPVGQQAGSVGA
jgi:hypothetical protein